MKKVFVLSFSIFLITSLAFAQCPTASEVMRADRKNGWSESGLSKSGLLNKGEEYEYNFIAQKGIEYRLTALGGIDNVVVENVSYQLYDTEIKKIKNSEGKEEYKRVPLLIYDSQNAQEGDELIFSTEKTRKLTLKLTVQDGEADDTKIEYQCVVVFIETRRLPGTGLK